MNIIIAPMRIIIFTNIMKTLKSKPPAHTTSYSINVLSKCSNIISHRSSIFEGGHIDHRSSKVDTSTIEGRHIDHRSSKVDTSIIDLPKFNTRSSIFEGRHSDFRRSEYRSSIFEVRRRKHCTDNPTSHHR